MKFRGVWANLQLIQSKWQHGNMKHINLRDNLLVHKTWLIRLAMVGLLLGAAFAAMLGPLSSSARAQGSAAEGQGAVTPEAMAALQKRVKMLEGQISDLRTMIGTISTLRQRPDLGTGASAGMSTGAPAQQPAVASGSFDAPPPPRFGAPTPRLAGRGAANASTMRQASGLAANGFDAGRAAPIGGATEPAAPQAEPVNTENAQKLYNDAYSHMLRRDYAAAEKAFGALVRNHPDSRMAGNAQYWLGETYYVRGKYRPAADAFLKAYRNYSNGVKAPDSLMKLALSLKKLGQTRAACKTFDELAAKFPNAPRHVKQRAGMERRRAHCN